jgi:hypothetical protein
MSKVGCARQAASVNHALDKQHWSTEFSPLGQGIRVKGQGYITNLWARATSQSQGRILNRFVILPISPGTILGKQVFSRQGRGQGVVSPGQVMGSKVEWVGK